MAQVFPSSSPESDRCRPWRTKRRRRRPSTNQRRRRRGWHHCDSDPNDLIDGCWDADATPPLMLFDMEGCNIVIDLYIIIYDYIYIWLYIYDYIYNYIYIYICMYVCIDIARWPVKVVIKTARVFLMTLQVITWFVGLHHPLWVFCLPASCQFFTPHSMVI